MKPVRLEPPSPRSQVKHSTTEPLRSSRSVRRLNLHKVTHVTEQVVTCSNIAYLLKTLYEPRHEISNTGMCDQRRLRPACAYTQSDQSLCWSLEYSMTFELLVEYHLEFLSLIGGCTGSSECTFVKMPHCWKSHVTALIIIALHWNNSGKRPDVTENV